MTASPEHEPRPGHDGVTPSWWADGELDTAVVLTGGGPVDATVADRLPSGAVVIAADSGAAHAAVLGLPVDVVVGDFDSLAAEELQRLQAAGVVVERHPTDKDATDLELALIRAVELGVSRVTVVGGGGGRLDHLLGVALVLGAPAFAGMAIDAHLGATWLAVVRSGGSCRVTGAIGDLVSLLPLHGPVRAVTTSGLRWALSGEDLAPGSTRGVSNELVADRARVTVGLGSLLVVKPCTRDELAGPPATSTATSAKRTEGERR